MRKNFYLHILLSLFIVQTPNAQPKGQTDVLLQGFHWNSHPGDLSNTTSGGVWWDSLATIAPILKYNGFKTVWLPAFQKSYAGVYDMGYGPYDYYDLGKLNQKGTTRTRFGTETQLRSMVSTLKANNLSVMADIVLNHRAGSDEVPTGYTPPEQKHASNTYLLKYECVPVSYTGDAQYGYTYFNPASNHFPGDYWHFHPNNYHCDNNGDVYTKSFFEDVSPMNHQSGNKATVNATSGKYPWMASQNYYFGPHNIGPVGDSLIVWARWLKQSVGVDEFRLDAIKHVEDFYLPLFLIESNNGAQPFAVGEHWSDRASIRGYQQSVESYTYSGGKKAELSVFDFPLRYALKDMANGNGSYNMWDLNTQGFVLGGSESLPGTRVATFVENHDVDRGGWRRSSATPSPPCASGTLVSGDSCLEYYYDGGHDPITQNKHLAYAYIMAAEGRPTVYWKDYFWFDLEDDINWLMALRKAMAGGTTTPISALNSSFGTGHGGDLFVMRRNGFGGTYVSALALNDNTGTKDVWIDSGYSDMEMKDYTDSFMFQTTRAFADGRLNVKAGDKNYAWYAPTGLYPQPATEPSSAFTLKSGIQGAKAHYVVLRASDAATLQVNGRALQAGDEIAVIPNASTDVVGIARHGQKFRWDGVHDMVIEVLGGANATEGKTGLRTGDSFRLLVRDSITGNQYIASAPTFLANSTAFCFYANRPSTRYAATGTSCRSASTDPDKFSLTTTSATNTFSANAISVVTAFSAATTSGVTLNTKAFLQGAYSSGSMNTALKTSGYLPISQPYSGATFSATKMAYNGTESVASIPTNVVDWVLVELRTGTAASTKVATQAVFLRNDGQLVALDGTSLPTFTGIADGNYYIVIRHRNHLPVMSATAHTLASASSTLYNFSTAVTQAYGTSAMKDLGSGVFGMYAGDVNMNGIVKYSGVGNDALPIFNAIGNILSGFVTGYHQADVNMNGTVKYSGIGNDRLIIFNTVDNSLATIKTAGVTD